MEYPYQNFLLFIIVCACFIGKTYCDSFSWQPEPQLIQSGQVLITDYTAIGVAPGASIRSTPIYTIMFNPAFNSTPQVSLAPTLFYGEKMLSLGYNLQLLSFDTTKFQYQVSTTANTIIKGFAFRWIAAANTQIQMKYFETSATDLIANVNLGTGPRKYVQSQAFLPTFSYTPIVFMFLTKVNINAGVSTRLMVQTNPSSITKLGFDLQVTTALDSLVTEVGVFWIAFQKELNFYEGGQINGIYPGSQLDPYPQFFFTNPLQTNRTFISPFFGIKNLDFAQSVGNSYYAQLGVDTIVYTDTYRYSLNNPPVTTEIYEVSFNFLFFKFQRCPNTEFLLLEVDCSPLCPIKYYQNLESNVCSPCHTTCVTCTGPNSNNCATCKLPSRDLNLGTFQCDCTPAYFEDGLFRDQCARCDQKCATCSNTFEDCSTCVANRISPPQCTCPDNHWDPGSLDWCRKCYRSCQNCNGENPYNCLTCKPTYVISPQMTCDCPMGTFQNIPFNTCDGCHRSCIGCKGPLASDCTSCDPTKNRAILDTKCICLEGFSQDDQGDCIRNSPLTCIRHCFLCATSEKCLTCINDRILLDNNCICRAGYYENKLAECQSCHPTCAQCEGPLINQCISCHDGYEIKQKRCEQKEGDPQNAQWTGMDIGLVLAVIFVSICLLFLIPFIFRREWVHVAEEEDQFRIFEHERKQILGDEYTPDKLDDYYRKEIMETIQDNEWNQNAKTIDPSSSNDFFQQEEQEIDQDDEFPVSRGQEMVQEPYQPILQPIVNPAPTDILFDSDKIFIKPSNKSEKKVRISQESVNRKESQEGTQLNFQDSSKDAPKTARIVLLQNDDPERSQTYRQAPDNQNGRGIEGKLTSSVFGSNDSGTKPPSGRNAIQLTTPESSDSSKRKGPKFMFNSNVVAQPDQNVPVKQNFNSDLIFEDDFFKQDEPRPSQRNFS